MKNVITEELKEELSKAYESSKLRVEKIQTATKAISKEKESIKKLEWIEKDLSLPGKSEEELCEYIIKQMGKGFMRTFLRGYIPDLKELHLRNIHRNLEKLKETS